MPIHNQHVEHWHPGASLDALRARAELLKLIRDFLQQRGVLEVETPILCSAPATDPSLTPIAAGPRWLQTSPEYAMKRLLAAGSGPIYQICKAFRHGEAGPRHNPEFTLLEWYRPGFTLSDLIAETVDLVTQALGERPVEQVTYCDLFERYLEVNPLTADVGILAALARQHVDYASEAEHRDIWLDLLMSHVIEPKLSGITVVYHYPASQAALAQIDGNFEPAVALRFELYVDALELANGYQELTDPEEQAERFAQDNLTLEQRGEPVRVLDSALLAALHAGMPDCAGVALGLDRLLAIQLGASSLKDVISFDWTRC
ncbi:MAG: EF-P lysine aminoacylase EpmA [Pseudomonadota bacterium]